MFVKYKAVALLTCALLIPQWSPVGSYGQSAASAAEVRSLIEQAGSSDYATSRKAVEALATVGVPAVNLLLSALEAENERVRSGAAAALGKIGHRRAVEPLIAALVDESRRVRNNAAKALGEIGDKRAVGPLVTVMKLDGNPYPLRRFAAEALEEMDAVPQEGEDYVWYLIIKRRMADCVMLGDVAVGPLIALMQSEYWLVPGAPSTLALIGNERSIQALLAAVKDDNTRDRASVAEALGETADERAVEPLVAMLKTFSGPASRSLKKLGWTPRTKVERACFLIGLHDPAVVDPDNWEDVKSVLMQEGLQRRPREVSPALFTY